MLVLITLLFAVAFTALFRVPLKKVPWLFYLLAIALDVVVIFAGQIPMPKWLYTTLVISNARGIFGFWLFAIVMFMGTLPRGSELRRKLIPIRAELSITAAIVIVGHCVKFWDVYSFRALAESAARSNGILAAFVIAVILVVLLVLLTVTSFYFVKRLMGGKRWKMLQRLAYPFFVFTYAHIGLAILPGAMHGSVDQLVGIVVYGLAVVVYVVLRVRRYKVDKAAREEARRKNVEFVDDTVATLR